MLDIVKHPLFQRLTRIKQLGLTSIVFPGAQHTRFQHSLGAFSLMSEAILSLQQKGTFIFDSEAEAVEAAILLHDIGHGPFSHVLENTLISGISHEDISLMMMEKINKSLNGQLNLAIQIFKGQYPKKFLHQLISSQLDMDRLDYLRRDSFFTGVNEGNIGSARIIKMLNVYDDQLVVDHKAIYSIENYLTSRRLMYWQVYLHKTTVAAEKMLINTLLRAKHLAHEGKDVFGTPALRYFLYNNVDRQWFEEHDEALINYEQLDDNDIWSALKVWMHSDDKILSRLSTDLMERRIFKVEVSETEFDDEYKQNKRQQIAEALDIDIKDTDYFLCESIARKDMYDVNDDHISLLGKDEMVRDITECSELLNIDLLSKKVSKHYLCFVRA